MGGNRKRGQWAVRLLGLAVVLLGVASCAPQEGPVASPAVSGGALSPPPPAEAPAQGGPSVPAPGEAAKPAPATPPGEGGAFQSPLAGPVSGEPPKAQAVETPQTSEGQVQLPPPSQGPSGQPAGTIPFRTVARGTLRGTVPSRFLLLVSEGPEGLAVVRESLPSDVVTQAERQADFARELLLTVFVPARDASGTVRVESLNRVGQNVRVMARVPGGWVSGEDVAQEGAAPFGSYHVVAISKADLPGWSQQPLRFVLRNLEGQTLARTIPPSPVDVPLEFHRLAQGTAVGEMPARMQIYVAGSAQDLREFLPYIKDRSHRQAIQDVDLGRHVVVAAFRGRFVGRGYIPSVESVRRAATWVVLHATFSLPPTGLTLPLGEEYAYDVVRLRKADLPGWSSQTYRFFLEGEQRQQLAEVRVPASPSPEAPKPLSLSTVARGEVLGTPLGEATLFVAAGRADLGAFVNLIDDQEQVRAIRSTAFDRELLLAFFGLPRPTSGHGLLALDVAREGQGITLVVREEKPSPGVFVAEAFHTPYLVVALPRDALPDWGEAAYDFVVKDAQGQTLFSTQGGIQPLSSGG
ncbi:MAG: protease complex subunit PrcB family protein [Anaerolineae bacterium]